MQDEQGYGAANRVNRKDPLMWVRTVILQLEDEGKLPQDDGHELFNSLIVAPEETVRFEYSGVKVVGEHAIPVYSFSPKDPKKKDQKEFVRTRKYGLGWAIDCVCSMIDEGILGSVEGARLHMDLLLDDGELE